MSPEQPFDGAITVADLVARAAARTPGRPAVVDGNRRHSWAELNAAIDTTARALRQAGLQVGDRVVLQAPNSLEFVEAYLGALRAGLTVVPLNSVYTVPELVLALTDSTARALITASVEAITRAPELIAELEHLDLVVAVVSGASNAATPPDGTTTIARLAADSSGDVAELPTIDAEAPAVILYTSGTSGRPKGAMLSHRALLSNIAQISSVQPPLATANDVVLLPVPLAHIYGLNAGLGLALAHGSTVVLVERFDPAASLETAAAEGVTILLGAPVMFAAWAAVPGFADRLGGARFALSGSAPLPADLVARYAEAGVALHEGYGLTEAAPVVTLNCVGRDGSNHLGRPKAGSIGAPLPGVEIALLDNDGAPVEDDDPGRLAIRGHNLFSGYWPDGREGPDADGWFVTGDLAYADADGDLVIVGRDSELVLVSGFNVYPAEIEAVLSAVDGVAEVAVLGIPDDATGESLVAYVVPAPGAEIDPEAVLAGAARSLARFKLPRRIEIVESLPHTITGKVKKWQLRTEEATAE